MRHRLNLHGLEGWQFKVIRRAVVVVQPHGDEVGPLHFIQGVGQCHKHAHHAHDLKADRLRGLHIQGTALHTLNKCGSTTV